MHILMDQPVLDKAAHGGAAKLTKRLLQRYLQNASYELEHLELAQMITFIYSSIQHMLDINFLFQKSKSPRSLRKFQSTSLPTKQQQMQDLNQTKKRSFSACLESIWCDKLQHTTPPTEQYTLPVLRSSTNDPMPSQNVQAYYGKCGTSKLPASTASHRNCREAAKQCFLSEPKVTAKLLTCNSFYHPPAMSRLSMCPNNTATAARTKHQSQSL